MSTLVGFMCNGKLCRLIFSPERTWWPVYGEDVPAHHTASCSGWPLRFLHGLQEVQRLPHNQVTTDLTAAMAAAVKAFGNADAVMVMVVQPKDNNSYDQQVCWPVQCLLYQR